jgi:hypothetical protein
MNLKLTIFVELPADSNETNVPRQVKKFLFSTLPLELLLVLD